MKTNQYDRASRAATLRPALRLSLLERDRDVVSYRSPIKSSPRASLSSVSHTINAGLIDSKYPLCERAMSAQLFASIAIDAPFVPVRIALVRPTNSNHFCAGFGGLTNRSDIPWGPSQLR
jgi:hypothetical protein